MPWECSIERASPKGRLGTVNGFIFDMADSQGKPINGSATFSLKSELLIFVSSECLENFECRNSNQSEYRIA